MAPLVLIGTVLTHLFGGSAGREGTAVQMGGSMAASLGRRLGLSPHDSRILLMAGVAAGFGAVFGTPLAGAVFAMEVLAIGRMSYESLVPCLAASVIGDCTVRGWGIAHSHYYITSVLSSAALTAHSPLSLLLMTKVIIAAIAFGLAAVLFAELTHRLHRIFAALVPWPVLRPVLGGVLVIGLVFLLGTRDYLGLGTNADPATPNAVTIASCFSAGGATWWSWWWKILFTAVTLSSGFKGGEVTPLFFIGAALGNTAARAMGAPVDLFAGLGFVAVFAGATNTPLACTIMGLELFLPNSPGLLNSGFGIYLPVACFLAYLVSGHSGIYSSQRIGMPKIDLPDVLPDTPLHVAREIRRVSHDQPILRTGSRTIPQTSSNLPEGEGMSHSTQFGAHEIGQLRIFLTARERRNKGFRGLFGKPVYQEIIHAAKEDGVLNAIAHRMHFGYSGQSKVEHDKHEIPNEYLTLCVELIGGGRSSRRSAKSIPSCFWARSSFSRNSNAGKSACWSRPTPLRPTSTKRRPETILGPRQRLSRRRVRQARGPSDGPPRPRARQPSKGGPDFGELPSGLSLRVEDSRAAATEENPSRRCPAGAKTKRISRRGAELAEK